jgi:hypothetical protein
MKGKADSENLASLVHGMSPYVGIRSKDTKPEVSLHDRDAD